MLMERNSTPASELFETFREVVVTGYHKKKKKKNVCYVICTLAAHMRPCGLSASARREGLMAS